MSTESAKPGRFIVGPVYDHLFFIWPPLFFLLVGAVIDFAGVAEARVHALGRDFPIFPVFAVGFTTAHVLAVFFRSHLNATVRKQYPIRLFVVPVIMLLLMNVSSRFLAIMAVYLVWFDVWHSSLQTFGLGRIYDVRNGNPPALGRNLDIGLALVTYAGPIIGGVTLYTQFERFQWLANLGIERMTDLPIWTIRNQTSLMTVVAILGTIYVAYYLYAYSQLAKKGYKVSREKILLYVSLSIASVWSWGFDTFGQSYLTMECFHALQYFAVIRWTERDNLQKTFGLSSVPWGGTLAMAIVVVTTMAGGFWAAAFASGTLSYTIILTATFCHFWWDGFIWSVQKKSHFQNVSLLPSGGQS
ncbi:MAG: hypothetical protein HYV07_12280 [Deltaproteobacteria bacterium]|nr:hypothetical protein [Deltaproteobacteria bacterium]